MSFCIVTKLKRRKEGHVDAAPLYVIRICRFNEIMSYVNLEVYQDSLQ